MESIKGIPLQNKTESSMALLSSSSSTSPSALMVHQAEGQLSKKDREDLLPPVEHSPVPMQRLKEKQIPLSLSVLQGSSA